MDLWASMVNHRACIVGRTKDVTAVVKAVEDRNRDVTITCDADIADVDWTTNREAWTEFFTRYDDEDAHSHMIIRIVPREHGEETMRALMRAAEAQNKGVQILLHSRLIPYLHCSDEYTRNHDASKCLCAETAAMQTQANTVLSKAQELGL